MPSKSSLIQQLREAKIMAVVRAASSNQAIEIAKALLDGGVCGIEITFSTPNAPQAIETLRELSENGQLSQTPFLGAGTVLNSSQARAAYEAGAQFFVSPCTIPEVIETVNGFSTPCLMLPGAFTPTEIFQAHALGGDVIKVFPAARLGPDYFKDLRGPLPHIPLMPTGGVDASNAKMWLQNGAVALGAGSNILPSGAIQSGNFQEITKLARELVEATR